MHAITVAREKKDYELHRKDPWWQCVHIPADERAVQVVSCEHLYRAFLTFAELSDCVKLPRDGEWDKKEGRMRQTSRHDKRQHFTVGLEQFQHAH